MMDAWGGSSRPLAPWRSGRGRTATAWDWWCPVFVDYALGRGGSKSRAYRCPFNTLGATLGTGLKQERLLGKVLFLTKLLSNSKSFFFLKKWHCFFFFICIRYVLKKKLFQNKLVLELSLWALQSHTNRREATKKKRTRGQVKLQRMNTTTCCTERHTYASVIYKYI